MPLLSDRVRPWLGSAVIHLAFVALLAVAAFNWRRDPAPEPLAIEGRVVREQDLPPGLRTERPTPRPAPAAEPAPAPVEQRPEPVPEPTTPPPEAAAEVFAREQARLAAERRAEEARAVEAQRQRELEAQQAREAEAAAARKRETEAAAARQREAEAAEAKRKAEEARRQEAVAARERQLEQERTAREAKARAEREAELRRALESEEEGEAVARSGIVDEYKALLTQTIERNWNRPASARPGLKCTLYVTQATGGTVLDVKIGECNGDAAVRESITNAVYKSDPLPAPRDPRAFQRQLVMNFEPKE